MKNHFEVMLTDEELDTMTKINSAYIPLFVIIERDGTIYGNKAYTIKDHAVRIFDSMANSGIYEDAEFCLHVLWLPFIGRSVSYIHESEFTVPDNSCETVMEAQNYYRRKIFACEEHAKKSEILKAIYDEVGPSGVSIQHIRVIKN